MIPTLRLFSRTTYRGASGSGPGRSGHTSFKSSPDSRSAAGTTHNSWFKRSQRGLYDGTTLQSGNTISDSRQKTRRYFQPNVQHKNLYSETLNRNINIKTTSRALRTIEKKGGLEAYLANTKDHKLGQYGIRLRDEMIRELESGQASTNTNGIDVAVVPEDAVLGSRT